MSKDTVHTDTTPNCTSCVKDTNTRTSEAVYGSKMTLENLESSYKQRRSLTWLTLSTKSLNIRILPILYTVDDKYGNAASNDLSYEHQPWWNLHVMA